MTDLQIVRNIAHEFLGTEEWVDANPRLVYCRDPEALADALADAVLINEVASPAMRKLAREILYFEGGWQWPPRRDAETVAEELAQLVLCFEEGK
jgi:hypothetical protein